MGGGVARSATHKYPGAQRQFSEWILQIPRRERLGQVHFAGIRNDTFIASLIAQEGDRPSSSPHIRYAPLERCFSTVMKFWRSTIRQVFTCRQRRRPKRELGILSKRLFVTHSLRGIWRVDTVEQLFAAKTSGDRERTTHLNFESDSLIFVVLSGQIGAGKSALAEKLVQKYDARVVKRRAISFASSCRTLKKNAEPCRGRAKSWTKRMVARGLRTRWSGARPNERCQHNIANC